MIYANVRITVKFKFQSLKLSIHLDCRRSRLNILEPNLLIISLNQKLINQNEVNTKYTH